MQDKTTNPSPFPSKLNALKQKIEEKMLNKQDLNFTVYQNEKMICTVFFITYLTDQKKLEEHLLHPLLQMEEAWTNNEILNALPLKQGRLTTKIETIIEELINGHTFIYVENEKEIIFYDIANVEKRSLEKAETESIVVGPQLSFTESLTSNLNIINAQLNSSDLALDQMQVGERISKEVRIIYFHSLANETDVQTIKQRTQDIDVDIVGDIHMYKQYIMDKSTSVFPQFNTTELLDRSIYAIKSGKIVVLIEDSPLALIAPSTFFSFFESTEDQYLPWNSGTFMRLLRMFAMLLTLILTPMYVVATTYHYELIPTQLLISLGQSRAAVPFPPIMEVLLLELMIELLREAGARLPTKVGQTIGIVGGVVVGTAAVQAGITSNILIILVTLSALASFTAPSYIMGTAIRLVRFPIIILSGFYGIIGLMFAFCLLTIHLIRLESLGRPYLSPIYPLQLKDFNKVFFRLPQQRQGNRFKSYQLKDKRKFDKKRAITRKDIDE